MGRMIWHGMPRLSNAEYQSSVLFNRQDTVELSALNSDRSCDEIKISFSKVLLEQVKTEIDL